MNFRSVNDLFSTVRRQLYKLPQDVDLIVGVPRSGLLAANVVSLFLNRPFIDLDSFIEGRRYRNISRRLGWPHDRATPTYKSVLVIDDSIFSGAAMQEVRKRIQGLSSQPEVFYAAVYGLVDHHSEVDLTLEKCDSPRVFEWNLLHHPRLDMMCLDLDGVLCLDPTDAQDDDGPNYNEFLTSSSALNVPRYKINSIVTARLEKYRPQTEAWLKARGIRYDNLFMLDLPSAAVRRKLGIHAEFKADIYKLKSDCRLFVESNAAQARVIRERTGKSVLAYQDMIYYSESGIAKVRRAVSFRGLRYSAGQLVGPRGKAIIKSTLRI